MMPDDISPTASRLNKPIRGYRQSALRKWGPGVLAPPPPELKPGQIPTNKLAEYFRTAWFGEFHAGVTSGDSSLFMSTWICHALVRCYWPPVRAPPSSPPSLTENFRVVCFTCHVLQIAFRLPGEYFYY